MTTNEITPAFDVRGVLDDALGAADVRHVFGEPCRLDEVTVIPVARIGGGVGGGGGRGPDDSGGSGGGAGVASRPLGAYVVRGGEVRWQAAVNWERVALAALGVVALAVWAFRPRCRRRSG